MDKCQLNMGIIYKSTCTLNGKIYIGQTIQALKLRRRAHETAARQNRTSTAFNSALRKYGVENFEWEILETCDARDLNERETEAIRTWNSICPNGYNIQTGGKGIEVHREHKRKRPEDATLPQHVHRFENKTHAGYRVQLADGRKKAFLSSHYTAEEKLAMATEWCSRALTDSSVHTGRHLRKSKEDAHLPEGVVRFLPKDRKMPDYRVRASGPGQQPVIHTYSTESEALSVHDAMHALVMLSKSDPRP